jgi:5,10-methylenetetrahydromethanopterin reductase
LKFGTIEIPRSIDSAVYHAQLAESVGFDFLGVADSQSLYREVYMTAALMAKATERALIGPAVTNFITRHLAVTASAMGTLDEVSGGRALLGVASGDSAIYNIGERPTKLAEMREAMLALRNMFDGQLAPWRGAQIHAEWVKRPIPLYVAAEGPRTLELTGEVADGVMAGMGLSSAAIELTLNHLGVGAERAGRSLDDLDVWVLARVNIGDDRQALINEIRMELASTAHHAFRFTLDGKDVPDALRERIMAVQRGYNPRRHEALGESPNARLMQDAELLDYMAGRFAIVGTVEECAAQVRQLEALGVKGILFTGFVADRAGLLERIGEVIAMVRA